VNHILFTEGRTSLS